MPRIVSALLALTMVGAMSACAGHSNDSTSDTGRTTTPSAAPANKGTDSSTTGTTGGSRY
ncbi:MAG: hypothetical protein DME02_14215 [Candidatus Rokuibacteriota bacterium]|nr:MAG: hypothetical protein DME02_14215 [Candidatus Rokubacteria bacterium]